VEDLLLLAHFDDDRPLDLQPVDLSSVAAQAAGAADARRPGRPLTVAAAEPVIVTADASGSARSSTTCSATRCSTRRRAHRSPSP
jgi:hypothetical protein